jgi:hypothetical protein
MTGPFKSLAGVRSMALPELPEDLLVATRRAVGSWRPTPGHSCSPPRWRRLEVVNSGHRVWQPATRRAKSDGTGLPGLRRLAATSLVLGHVELQTA